MQNQVISGEGIHDVSDLKAFIKINIQRVFSYLDDPNQGDENDVMGEDGDDAGDVPGKNNKGS